MYSAIEKHLGEATARSASMAPERLRTLQQLADFMRERRADRRRIDIVFICIHNSRRSVLSQTWATVAVAHHHVEGVRCWSGGTEVTAVAPQVFASLERSGFQIGPDTTRRDAHTIRWSVNEAPIRAWSKLWNDAANPQQDFIAVMVCGEGEEACPYIAEAALRVSLPYNDPKAADGTVGESEAYDNTSMQIATEMNALFEMLRTDG